MEPITLLALGAGAVYLMKKMGNKPAYPLQAVKGGRTGRDWLARVVSITGDGESKLTTTELFAPSPIGEPQWIVTYRQTGSDKSSRVVLSINPSASPDLVTAAGQDFGIKKAT